MTSRDDKFGRRLLALVGVFVIALGAVILIRSKASLLSAGTLPAIVVLLLGVGLVIASAFYPRVHGFFGDGGWKLWIDRERGEGRR